MCNLSSERTYSVDASDTTYEVELNQSERLGDAVTDQTLSFSITPVESGPETGTYNFLFVVTNAEQLLPSELSDPDTASDRVRSTRHITNLMINGQQYGLAVEQRYDELDDITATSYLTAITRVIYAEGGGLVQFETRDGEIFSRVGTGARP